MHYGDDEDETVHEDTKAAENNKAKPAEDNGDDDGDGDEDEDEDGDDE
jgi:hypothetical protein